MNDRFEGEFAVYIRSTAFGVNVDPGGGQLVGEAEFLPPYLLSAQSLGVPAISRGR